MAGTMKRWDGTMPDCPFFILAAKDPSAPHALRAYATDAMVRGMDADYIRDVFAMADRFEAYRASSEAYQAERGAGDPGGVGKGA